MDSIAVLYSLKKDEKPRKIDANVSGELHINYCKLPLDKGKDYERFLDFGFMINEVAIDIHTVYFYLPFSLSNNDLEDLGECLHKNNFISTLFNDDLNIHSNTHNPSYYTIKPSNSDRDAFWLYILGKDNTFIATCKQAKISFQQFFCKYLAELKKGRTDYENLLPMTICLKS